jgi:hypothetical protein
MVGPALAAGPSRDARDNRDGLPTSGSPTIAHRKRGERHFSILMFHWRLDFGV